jgi:hypothetical protein
MKQILLLSFLFISLHSFSQKSQYLQVGGGHSKHGTGDLRGIAFYTEYGKAWGKRTDWAINVMTTIHGGAFKVIITDQDGTRSDHSFRYNTSGLQVGPKLGYSIIHTKRHQFKVQGGGFFRYQNSTLPDMYSFHLEMGSGIPQPQFEFRHLEKQDLFTVGYSLDLSYQFITAKNLMIGVKGGAQNDSNGDMIVHYGVMVGKRF